MSLGTNREISGEIVQFSLVFFDAVSFVQFCFVFSSLCVGDTSHFLRRTLFLHVAAKFCAQESVMQFEAYPVDVTVRSSTRPPNLGCR